MHCRGRLGIVVVALHDDVAADDDLAERLAVARHLVALVVHHAQLAGGDQFDALPRLDRGPFVAGKRRRAPAAARRCVIDGAVSVRP